jgi:hypothetical protein
VKPFDLEAAKRGEKLVTRDGREVTEFKYFETESTDSPCCAIVNGSALWLHKDGTATGEAERAKPYDLFMAPKMVTKYLNVYDSDSGLSYKGNNSCVFDSKTDAEGNADRNSVKVIVRAMPIQWEEK